MTSKSAVIVVCDGLSSRYLGPYGNHTVPTPSWNRLAAESALFEFCLAQHTELGRIYDTYFDGAPGQSVGPNDTLATVLRQKGVKTTCISDSTEVAELADRAQFDDVLCLPQRRDRELVGDVSETRYADLLATAAAWLEEHDQGAEPFLLWVHCQGMTGCWDAPYDLRQYFADEEDPDPPREVEAPQLQSDAPLDDDLVLGWRQAYCAQVMAWDMCLESFLDHLATTPSRDQLALVMTSARGYPLGEHARIGLREDALFGEVLSVPLILRFPDGRGAGARYRHLTQSSDLLPTLASWCGAVDESALASKAAIPGRSLLPLVDTDEEVGWRDRLAIVLEGQQVLRTASWQLRCCGDESAELFAKPEDLWELNDVADRCVSEVALLRELLAEYVGALSTPLQELSPLPANLEAGM